MKGRNPPVEPDIFQAMQNVDINLLSNCSEAELRAVLPCLVRTALCASVDTSEPWTKHRKDVLKILSGVEVVNSIVALLSIDFNALEQDVKREQQLRSKAGSSQNESVLISQLLAGLAREFEQGDPARRIRLLLSELLFVMSQMKEPKQEFYVKQSELFESEVYLEEVSDVLCIAQAELPALLPIQEVGESLLHVQNGPWLLCRLVANSPDCFKEVCWSLVARGERQDEESVGGRRRMEMLQILCAMNPKESLYLRSLCVQHCTMPGLSVSLTLGLGKLYQSGSNTDTQSSNDLVAYVSGLLLGNNVEVRNWFSQFIKAGQKRQRDPTTSMLHSMRLHLLEQLISVIPKSGEVIEEVKVIQASSFIRLYCALKGMATLRFTDEEMKLLLKLVTARPPPTASGARFISLSLCMLIACPYLLGNQEQEQQVIEWIRWLISAESSFEKETGKGSAFGEMLFLIAIHFHGNHMHAIAELVCSTLGMKSAVKANALARVRQIFTNEVFTEQVITAHAVTVPVTENLNANMTGYLPIHCIYQLLKSRAFSKYKVPIKDWIYNQLRQCSVPIHPLVPSLIEVYVNSIIVKSAKSDHTNEPIRNSEVLALYRDSVFSTTDDGENGKEKGKNLAPQLLLLYYILLYEDTLHNQLKNMLTANREVISYPETLMAQIPINYLVQEAQRHQDLYGGLFTSLLRLLVTQYPHLCIVEDWLEDSVKSQNVAVAVSKSVESLTDCTVQHFQDALSSLSSSPMCVLTVSEKMLKLPIEELLPFSTAVVDCLPLLLSPDIPLKVVDSIQRIWFKLHSLTPRNLRLATVNALRPKRKVDFMFTPFTEADITVDPLIVLRCDERVFRCPPILEVILRVLAAYTQASRVYMDNHIQSNPVLDGNNQLEQERTDMKNALLAAQESGIIQILLECCLAKEEEQDDCGLLNNLREVQGIICSYIHQCFISDPNLAKLIHFQGYPAELIPVTVVGIPSMHICLDFIPELLSQPQLEKQVFGIKLTAQLCGQYAVPKSMAVAKLSINVMFAMVGVLESKNRVDFFLETVPSLVKICHSFPPLCEDVTTLLTQLGRVCVAHLSSTSNKPHTDVSMDMTESCDSIDHLFSVSPKKKVKLKHKQGMTVLYHELYQIIQRTFANIVTKAIVTRDIYVG